MKKLLILVFLFVGLSVNGQIKFHRDIAYDFIHGVAAVEATTYTPNVTQNVYFKLRPTLVVTEQDGITIAGDSITIVTKGDYFVRYSVTFSGGNTEDWRVKLYKNNATTGVVGSNHISTTGAGNYVTLGYFWYILDLVAGDDLCFKIVNTTNNNDPTITDMKVYIEKKPE